MKDLSKLNDKEFKEELAEIERARKEYINSDEYIKKLRDKGEEIMRILIEDGCNTAMNLSCSVNIIGNIKDSEYKPMCSDDKFQETKELYNTGEGSYSAMKQANDLIQKITKVYYS